MEREGQIEFVMESVIGNVCSYFTGIIKKSLKTYFTKLQSLMKIIIGVIGMN